MRRIEKPCPPWEVSATIRDGGSPRPIVVRITPYEIEVRQKGRRRSYSLPWQAVYMAAVRAAVEEARQNRRKKGSN